MTNAPQKPDVNGANSLGSQPLVLLELIQRLKVRDVMTTDLLVAARETTLRTVQTWMRDRKISGVPVVERGRLLGVVSIDDIIRALEGGYIDDSCQKHMTTKLVVLEDDMPLSFAISYFDRYRYGRFPVLNRKQALVGIICQRDINRTLLVELSNELRRLEERSHIMAATTSAATADPELCHEYSVSQFDFENAGKAATAIKKMLHDRGLPPRVIRRVAVAAYELEINLCVHSTGGVLLFQFGEERIVIEARDSGPGIADVEWACRDGSSTANDWIRSLGFGAGLGLPNVQRVVDKFDIQSKVGQGTTVRVEIALETSGAVAD